jgi:hypothetical protein
LVGGNRIQAAVTTGDIAGATPSTKPRDGVQDKLIDNPAVSFGETASFCSAV